MSDTPNIDFVLSHVSALKSLLEDPHPGLMSWVELYGGHMKALADFWGKGRESDGDDAIRFDLGMAEDLVGLFGGEDADVLVGWCADGEYGPGYYAWFEEYPEEGSVFLERSGEEGDDD